MGFFDFLKREKHEENEKITFEELEDWLKNKKKSNENKEKELLNLMKQRISHLTKEFEEEIAILKNLNLEEKKVEDRVKFIVKENLNSYILLLSKLVESLKKLDEKTSDAFIERINFIFADFGKKSFRNFQKATFLIGKEFEDVKKSMGNFFGDLKNIFENNKSFIENSKAVSFLLSKYNEAENIEKIRLNIHDKIKKIEQKIADLENKIKSAEKDIKKITESREYSEKIKKKEEVEKKKNELKQDIIKLKEAIDMKALARTFHESEKKMKIIKEYNKDFYGAFENDGGLSLLHLIDDNKKKYLNEMITDIQRKKEEIAKTPSEKDEIESLKTEIEKIGAEIKNLDKEKLDGLKRSQKLEEKKKELLEMIKVELAKIKIEIR